ncbi:MAG: DNA repair and recombination protein RadA, partial [Candidatus Aenigmarchaeota archaeon]|nr:DNA repair and recombination protein RadA [Candidatus Aenigmarchaeota archaeon]
MTGLKDLPGVGPKTVEKLEDAGYAEMMSLATASSGIIAAVADVGEGTAAKIINAARDALDMGFENGLKALERRKLVKKITTGSKTLDNLLGGGLETQAITECYGAFGSSKTQIAHQIAVNVQVPEKEGGLGGSVLFIDTENTFRPERIQQMSEAMGMDTKKVLEHIYIARAYNSDHQMILAEKAKDIMKEKNIKLVIVDSLMAHFRSDYVGRGTLSDRQQKLNRHMHELQKLGDTYNAAIYVTNQVMSKPNVLFGDPTEAIGGHIVGHTSTFRIYLRKSRQNLRVAKLVDSPHLPEGEAIFCVTSEGIK